MGVLKSFLTYNLLLSSDKHVDVKTDNSEVIACHRFWTLTLVGKGPIRSLLLVSPLVPSVNPKVYDKI